MRIGRVAAWLSCVLRVPAPHRGRSRCRQRLALLAALQVVLAGCSSSTPRAPDYELALAVPPYVPGMCVPPEATERQMLELAVSAIELDRGDIRNTLTLGAQRFLAKPLYRRSGDKTLAVCSPGDLILRLQTALERNGFGKGRLVEDQLELASRLPEPSATLVAAVALSAFNENIQESERFPLRDLRPYARSILAGFGRRAQPYAETAYAQMGIANSMQTGAAQVAAAAGHAEALPRIQRLMEAALENLSEDEAVPWETRNRLYELSWALVLVGEAGKRHTAPVHALMQRKVESKAPPFGIVAIRPKRLCSILARVEGEQALQAYAYCLDPKVPIEQ